MASNLTFEKIDKNFKDLDRVEELYNSAFPAEERLFTLRQALEMKDDLSTAENMAVYDGDKLIGFYSISDYGKYKTLTFIATDPNIRGKGYGGSIVKKILEDNKDGIIFGGIEKPVPGGDNYEIKLRRRNFYERNGMIITDREKLVNGVTLVTITNKTGEEFDNCMNRHYEVLDEYAKRASL